MRTFGARSPIYLPGEPAESVFLLVEGLIKVCNLTGDGKQSILAYVEPGEVFGELAMFDGEQREEYVESVDETTVVVIPASELQKLMVSSHDLSIAMTKMVCLRRHRIERRLKNLLFLSNRERLMHLLLDLSEQFGVEDPDGIRLRIKLAHQEIANLMGSTREAVTILLGHFKAEGLISIDRRQIVLTDVERLAAFVNRKVALHVA
ncbi:Crp/Fnr family transcriptional regulator [Rhodopirellula sp. ICT_H3.1]|uniref:Crp/Fnr family transcriptional regulator n=2 Tax=Aporhodopirellula aestuarii TaxID=2950107 RepID=A0ABT0U028_9BACT|nr:Crp/Fnr family transcriptional regulator [Aporhodopirellula aestuarii]